MKLFCEDSFPHLCQIIYSIFICFFKRYLWNCFPRHVCEIIFPKSYSSDSAIIFLTKFLVFFLELFSLKIYSFSLNNLLKKIFTFKHSSLNKHRRTFTFRILIKNSSKEFILRKPTNEFIRKISSQYYYVKANLLSVNQKNSSKDFILRTSFCTHPKNFTQKIHLKINCFIT